MTWYLQGKLYLQGVLPILKGKELNYCVGRGGNSQHCNVGGTGDSKNTANVTKDDMSKAKNMLRFSENNVYLYRMGQIMSVFGNQAFDLDFDAVISREPLVK